MFNFELFENFDMAFICLNTIILVFARMNPRKQQENENCIKSWKISSKFLRLSVGKYYGDEYSDILMFRHNFRKAVSVQLIHTNLTYIFEFCTRVSGITREKLQIENMEANYILEVP